MSSIDVTVNPPGQFPVTVLPPAAGFPVTVLPPNQISVEVSSAIVGSGGGAGVLGVPVLFGRSGVLQIVAGAGRFPAGYTGTIAGVRAAVATAPTGAAVLVDVNKNGTTIFTTQANRPTIPAGQVKSANAIPDIVTVAAGDLFSIDIDQVGSSVAGSDLVVSVLYVENAVALPILYSYPGGLTLATGTVFFPAPYAGTVLGVRLAVGTAPTGAAVICDVNKNGVTMFTTQANRPKINAAATQSANAVPDVTTFVAGDLISVDIDQVGSAVAGSNLTASVLIAPS